MHITVEKKLLAANYELVEKRIILWREALFSILCNPYKQYNFLFIGNSINSHKPQLKPIITRKSNC